MNVHIKILFFCLCVTSNFLSAAWASVYHKKVAEPEAIQAAQANAFFFSQHSVPKFIQLLCSWNALRPKKGHLVFSVQARDAYSKGWGSWHRMVQWGNNVQKSHETK